MNKREFLSKFNTLDKHFMPIKCKSYTSALKICRTINEYYESMAREDNILVNKFIEDKIIESYKDEITLMIMKIMEDHCE